MKNLHTGVNTIRVRAYKPYTVNLDPNYQGPEYRDDTITVIVQGSIDESIKNINSGTAVIADYELLGITKVTSSNIANVRNAIIAAKEKKGSDLTQTEIEQVVEYAANEKETAVKNIIAGQGKLSDYQILGITNVKEENLEDVNWYLKEKGITDESQIKSNVNTVVSALSNINNGTMTLSYYQTLGITTVTSSNSTDVKNAIIEAKKEKGSNLTRIEIGKVAESVSNEREAVIKKIIDGQGSLNDYQMIGITNVKEENLEDVNWYLKEKGITNESQIKTNVNAIVTALNNINSGTTTIGYYQTLGITVVTSSNASNVKNAIIEAKKEKGSNLTRIEIGKVAESASNEREVIIKKIIDGQGSLNDYQMIGITNVKEENLEDVNWYLKEKAITNESQIKTSVNAIVAALNNINSGTMTIGYYQTLGITSVTSSNASNVKAAIIEAKKEKGFNLTRIEIGKVAESASNEREAAIKKIIGGQGTLNDYKMLGITNVKEENLEDVNWYLKEKGILKESEISKNVNIIINTLSYVNKGTTSISYYQTLGITTVTSSNVSNVKNAIISAKKEKGSDLTRLEIEKVILNLI
ncbi:hypothetical protein [Clostridium butyricum]|uniref:hypothetical protein n=1 Tax=Clostridium butyricum TaxID=1492 RepID=UPI0018A8A8C6|nr:hypothetical protein [Clostridium butyricum]